MPTGEVIQPPVRVRGCVVQVTMSLDKSSGGVPTGPRSWAGVVLAPLTDAFADCSVPNALGVGPGAFPDQDGVARPVRDVGHAGLAVAVEDTEAGWIGSARFVPAHAGGVAGGASLA